ncbi:MAG: hypothetical protein LKF75_02775 [Bacilli bacterium]|jgi:hypothetical protein|nr:hypothetical protein [Bacilli bacterium]MCH4210674.1 hypothetical protein [Bacilli bacterium]MCH4228609.1 hypothetical protein [Bacilli bacterium]MCH4277734.1 hypothetical protein [Bacilli bacterium]MCI2054849.1 hypothetical protein [Bacilli bacterium]
MKSYENDIRSASLSATIDELMTDRSETASERLADGMVLSYIDGIMSGNAQ